MPGLSTHDNGREAAPSALDAAIAPLGGQRADVVFLFVSPRHQDVQRAQSGKPDGVFRTPEWAPRVLISNAMLVPKWATWDEFPRARGHGRRSRSRLTEAGQHLGAATSSS